MAERPRKRLFANPFYFGFLVASTLFVVTALAYFVSSIVAQRAPGRRGAGPGPGSRSIALDWIDRRGPTALTVELTAMLATSVAAMATDRWFPSRPGRRDSRTR
jgi:hypothetical protein